MSTQSSPQPHPPQQQSDTSLSERRLSALKVVKYLFISSLIILIIGSVVLFGLSIDSIVNISANIDTIERFGVTELAVKRTERLQQQRLSALFSIIINSLIILLSAFGIISLIRDNFLLIIIFGIVNTIVLLISLFSINTKVAIVLLQIAVSLFAFSYTLSIYYKMRVELKKKKLKNRKDVKKAIDNNVEENHFKNNGIQLNGNYNHMENHNNNPEFDDLNSIQELKGVIV